MSTLLMRHQEQIRLATLTLLFLATLPARASCPTGSHAPHGSVRLTTRLYYSSVLVYFDGVRDPRLAQGIDVPLRWGSHYGDLTRKGDLNADGAQAVFISQFSNPGSLQILMSCGDEIKNSEPPAADPDDAEVGQNWRSKTTYVSIWKADERTRLVSLLDTSAVVDGRRWRDLLVEETAPRKEPAWGDGRHSLHIAYRVLRYGPGGYAAVKEPFATPEDGKRAVLEALASGELAVADAFLELARPDPSLIAAYVEEQHRQLAQFYAAARKLAPGERATKLEELGHACVNFVEWLDRRAPGLAVSKDNVVSLNDLAFFLAETGHPVRAVRLLRKILEALPGREVAQLNLADSLWDAGLVDSAREAYAAYKRTLEARHAQAPAYVAPRLKAACDPGLSAANPLHVHGRAPGTPRRFIVREVRQDLPKEDVWFDGGEDGEILARLDLNGDGVEDMIVDYPSTGGTGGDEHDVEIGCGGDLYVNVFHDYAETVKPARTRTRIGGRSWRDLTLGQKLSPAELTDENQDTLQREVARFDGSRYR